MRSRLECLLSAIASYNRSLEPDNPAYHANNPLRLGEFDKNIATGKLRKFKSLHAGIVSGLFDLKLKCSGKSNAKLGDGTIKDLMRVYNLHDGTDKHVAKYLRRACNDQAITENTKLDYFVEKSINA
jgi:hypothetical protein